MAGEIEISVRLKRLRLNEDALLEPGSAVYVAAERAGEAAVQHVRDEIRRVDAIDSGELYDSIGYDIYRSGRGISIGVGPKGEGAEGNLQAKATYVEYGTPGPIPKEAPKWMPVQIKRGPLLILSRVNGQEPKEYLRTGLKQVRDSDWY